MIRINLLSEGRKPMAARKSPLSGLSFSTGGLDAATLALVGLLVVGLLVALGQNWLLSRRVGTKTQEVAEAKAEVDRLAPIIKEVEDFKVKKADLETKVAVINELRANQRGPVQILDKVSRSLPELLWLSKMQLVGNQLSIYGEAFNTNAVALFIENLDKVPEFEEPIAGPVSRAAREQVYSFQIDVTFSHRAEEPVEDDLATEG